MFSFFSKVQKALSKTKEVLTSKLLAIFRKPWSEESLEEIEKLLYEADIGSFCIEEAIAHLKKEVREKDPTPETITHALKSYFLNVLNEAPAIPSYTGTPHVILIVGINGTGKTTSCAKLAKRYHDSGKKVMLAAADTFRAAASEQLQLWADRLNIPLIKSQFGSDPASVAFDALESAKAKNIDVVLIDTAGRLQSKAHLMQELEKLRRVISKQIPGAPHETILILDATNGQNAIDQAKVFHASTPLTGVILTKIDGTAKGGIVIPLTKELKLPILYLGTGEGSDDLTPFSKEEYIEALLGS